MSETVVLGQPAIATDAARAPASTFFIFGASGDLAKRLLMPALYNLRQEGVLDPDFAIVGLDRVEHTDEDFRTYLADAFRSLTHAGSEAGGPTYDEAVLSDLMAHVSYLQGDFADDATYAAIGALLAKTEKEKGQAIAVFYFAVAPRFFGLIAQNLAKAGLLKEGENAFRRIVVEKPFGQDLASAKALNAELLAAAAEHQIYRMDHFLGTRI